MSNEWDHSADLRKVQIESGIDLTFSRVFLPLYRGLVTKLQPKSILEVGAGTGHLAASLSLLTDSYVCVEPSLRMAEIAREVNQGNKVQVFQVTLQEAQVQEKFDLVISHMCLHSVDDMTGFLSALRSVMSPDSAFLISIPHPAFFNDYKKVIPFDRYSYMRPASSLIDFAITLDPNKTIAKVPYHHRAISGYFSEFSRADLSLQYFHEVYPSEEIQLAYGEKWTTPRYLLLGGGIRSTGDGVMKRMREMNNQR